MNLYALPQTKWIMDFEKHPLPTQRIPSVYSKFQNWTPPPYLRSHSPVMVHVFSLPDPPRKAKQLEKEFVDQHKHAHHEKSDIAHGPELYQISQTSCVPTHRTHNFSPMNYFKELCILSCSINAHNILSRYKFVFYLL